MHLFNTFQRVMEKQRAIFKGIPDVFMYVDDILIASSTHEEHVRTLHAVFRTIQEHGLGIALKKCSFFQSAISFLGFEIDVNGASPPEDRVKALKSLPMPDTPKGIQRFIGAVIFFADSSGALRHWQRRCMQQEQSSLPINLSSGMTQSLGRSNYAKKRWRGPQN